MKIAKYIGDLLYDYECVVIPGLGGFLTQDKPASVQQQTHRFRPPYKQVMFNAYLKTNDGLLVNYIAREENISYKEAKAQVDKFVFLCDQALKQGKRIHFHKVGAIYLNKNQKIVFEQDLSVNYNADAFGLTEFISPAVRHATPEEKLQKQGVNPHPATKRAIKKEPPANRPQRTSSPQTHRKARLVATKKKSPYKTQLIFLSGLIVAMLVGWGFMNKNRVTAYYENYSSVIPLFYSQPSAYVINNIDHVPVTRITDSHWGSWWLQLFSDNRQQPAAKNRLLTKTKQPETTQKTSVKQAPHAVKQIPASAAVVPTKTTSKTTVKKPDIHHSVSPVQKSAIPLSKKSVHHYYIIAGAFKNMHNVRSLVYSLKKKGYTALVIGPTPQGLHRVAYGTFDNRNQAETRLAEIRRHDNPSAWILYN